MLTVLLIIQVILIAYLFILSLRIVLGWFAPQALGRAWDLLARATDPYLAIFSRIKFLRKGLFDFSPIAAILVIVVVLNLVNQLLYFGRITLGFFLASVLSALWSGVWFLLLLFLIIGVVRTIPIIFRTTFGANLWKVMDLIMQPIVAWVTGLFRLSVRVGYIQRLLFTIGVLLVALVLGGLLVGRLLVPLFQSLPI